MPITYAIDPEKGIVTTTITGVLSFDECTEHHRRLGADPAFDPSYGELMDGGGVERVALLSTAVFSLSNTCPYGPTAIRAIFAGNKRLHFGIARMFQSLASGRHGTIEVFNDREEALQWLESKMASARQSENT